MIISRTPFRVSLFGGGTDYAAWYEQNGGAFLATTINKYCYITCRYLPPFFEHRSRIVYSQVEMVNEIDEIRHPAVRECLQFADITEGIEIHHDGDLPARSGLGSSSSFTVGLLNALYALKGRMVTKDDLARHAIEVEQTRLAENVGIQDQITVACGGFNKVSIGHNGDFVVSPLVLPAERVEELQGHLMLFFTGTSRSASDIAGEIIQSVPQKKRELTLIQDTVEEATRILAGGDDIAGLGKLLHETWLAKRSLGPNVTSSRIDEIYEEALRAGASGGKLIGAGGGGFMLLFAPPETHARIGDALAGILRVPFRFERSGSQIIYYDPESSDRLGEFERNRSELTAGNFRAVRGEILP